MWYDSVVLPVVIPTIDGSGATDDQNNRPSELQVGPHRAPNRLVGGRLAPSF